MKKTRNRWSAHLLLKIDDGIGKVECVTGTNSNVELAGQLGTQDLPVGGNNVSEILLPPLRRHRPVNLACELVV